jgi:hypothetical protein
MAAAIINPKPEVWPLRPARWGLSIGTLVPGMVDRALRTYRRSINEPNTAPASTAV